MVPTEGVSREVLMTPDGASAGRAKFKGLISRFINGQIAAEDFQTSYLRMFKNEADVDIGAEFDILEELFTDTDDYVMDPELRSYLRGKHPEFRKYVQALDEEELRVRAREGLPEAIPRVIRD
jgi:hypothetical protein